MLYLDVALGLGFFRLRSVFTNSRRMSSFLLRSGFMLLLVFLKKIISALYILVCFTTIKKIRNCYCFVKFHSFSLSYFILQSSMSNAHIIWKQLYKSHNLLLMSIHSLSVDFILPYKVDNEWISHHKSWSYAGDGKKFFAFI